MIPLPARLGLGIGWRPEIALTIDRRSDLGFVEIIAESFDPRDPLPQAIANLRERGVVVVPHGISLSLGSAERVDRDRVRRLGDLAHRVGAPLVSEHLAFVRGGGIESGHLLPLPRTRDCLEVVIENIREAQSLLPVPLAIENIASLVEWPDPEWDEATFVATIIEQADVALLLDLENIYANARNHRFDPLAWFDKLPLDRIAYVHVAGGIERHGVYHDTHAHPLTPPVVDLLRALAERTEIRGAMLERDDHFPGDGQIDSELDAIASAMTRPNVSRSLV